jgi:hypothetical protein
MGLDVHTASISPDDPVVDAADADLEPMQNDRRGAERRKVDDRVLMITPDLPGGVWCKLHDTSTTGALIEVPAEAESGGAISDKIADRLTLMFFTYKGRAIVNCQVVRRDNLRFGLRYIGPLDVLPLPRCNKPPA